MAKNSEYLRKLMTKVTMKDVLSKVQVQEKVILKPTRHMRYDLTLHLLPHRCYDSNTHITPKIVLKFIRNKFLDNLKKMFVKNLSKSFSGELISEQAKQAIKLNREENDNIDEDALLVSSRWYILYCKPLFMDIIILMKYFRMKLNPMKLNLKLIMKLIQIVNLKLESLTLRQ